MVLPDRVDTGEYSRLVLYTMFPRRDELLLQRHHHGRMMQVECSPSSAKFFFEKLLINMGL
jgi:hypothetical protein